jgi:biotin transport system permease protein
VLLRPLRRVGVQPERVSLLLALTIRAVPVLVGTLSDVRDARRARGLERSPRALLVPVVLRTMRHADRLGEALVARGVDD